MFMFDEFIRLMVLASLKQKRPKFEQEKVDDYNVTGFIKKTPNLDIKQYF